MNADINGINTNYIDKGEGDIVLLLQGWGTSVDLYSAVIDKAAEKYRVLAPDMPGFGATPEPTSPWHVGDYADFIIAFCEKLGVRECIIFAHSFGGRVTLKLTAREALPFTIKKIILTGAAGIRHEPSEEAKKKAAAYQRGKKFLSSAPMKALFPNALENLRNKHGSADYRAASPMMRQVLVNTVNEDLTPLLPKCTPETLLLWGRNDDAAPLCDGEQMEREMPDAGLVTLDNAGHFAFIEQQYMFLRVLSSFLEIPLD
ncbi:MAG: alpha/beta hydrolase [Ruminiclostridium sp.]|nr:alpha/beta hydrolase [Ruminiclostridium sp.]